LNASLPAAAVGAAVGTAVGVLVTGFVDGHGNASNSRQPPVSVSIDRPTNSDIRSINGIDGYTGQVHDIQKGQLVWLFNRQLSHTANPTLGQSDIYATTGPCTVTNTKWTCQNVGVGAAQGEPMSAGRYQVWVAVVTEGRAFDMVDSLRSAGGKIDDRVEPQHVEYAIDSMIVMR
jgi:hypothetical protein